MYYLLQIDSLRNATQAVAGEQISMLGLLQKGGWIMYPLYLLFIVAVFVFVERLLAIRKASRIEPNFMKIIR
ncbi:MAG TPA: biopolymer transporter ExbB, partial [Chitinophagaceae bacterium]|nr:biopolymer transporter ExbB [Chitinophagaceae bacterium]